MYICDKCKKKYKQLKSKQKNLFPLVDFLFSKDELQTVCKCGGNIVEMKTCKKCGKETTSEYSLCGECISKYKTLESALDIGEEWNETLEINGFLASVFTPAEIEVILIDVIKRYDEAILDSFVLGYCNDDEEYFKEYVERKWEKRI